MRFIDPYEDRPFLFAGNLTYIDLAGVPENGVVDGSVTIGNSSERIERRMTLYPDNGKIRFNLKEWSRNFESIQDNGSMYIELDFHEQNDLSHEDNWRRQIVAGSCNDKDYDSLVYGGRFWTKAPQTKKTLADGIEQLTLCNLSEGAVAAMVYSRTSPPVKIVLDEVSNVPNVSKQVIDCSFSKISELVQSEDIAAYDIFIEGYESEAQRFVVGRSRSITEFRFRNSLGVYDYIYASGAAKENLEYECVSFVNTGKETELANDSRKQFETFTGYLRTRAEAAFWQDFFLSADRCILDESRNWREIVVDEVSGDYTRLELGEMSFKWHYAEDIPEALADRKELKPYIP